MGQSRNGWEERGIPGNVAATSCIECHMSGHHDPLVLVLRLSVDHDGVHGVLLDPGRELGAVAHHGVEAHLVGAVGPLQPHFRGSAVEAVQRTLIPSTTHLDIE